MVRPTRDVLVAVTILAFQILTSSNNHGGLFVIAKKAHKGTSTRLGSDNEGGGDATKSQKSSGAAGSSMSKRFDGSSTSTTSSSSHKGCQLCGEGVEMYKPDGVITTEQGLTTTCAKLEKNSVHLPSDGIACQNLQDLAFFECQCEGWDDTDTQRTAENDSGALIAEDSGMDGGGALIAEDSDVGGGALIAEDSDVGGEDEIAENNFAGNIDEIPEDIDIDGEDEVAGEDIDDEFVCNICRGGGEIGNPDGLVIDSTTGQPTRCSVLHENRFSFSEEACRRIQAFAFGACDCGAPVDVTDEDNEPQLVDELYSCPVCGEGGLVGDPNGIVTNARGQTARCSLLEENQGNVPPNACSILQELAREPCACQMPPLIGAEGPETADTPQNNSSIPEMPVVELCSICGEGVITIPEGIVTNDQGREARCDVMQANAASIPAESCEDIQAFSRIPCGCSRVVNNDPQNIERNETLVGNEGIAVNTTINDEDVSNSTDIGNSTDPTETSICSICGDGVMNNPDGIVVTRQGQAARCSALDANADTIPESACPNIQALANIPCDCAEPSEPVNDDNGKDVGDEQEVFVCNVCRENQSIRDPDRRIVTSLGVYTCSNAYTAGLIGAIPSDHCDSLRISVAEECGCVADGPTQAPSVEPYTCSLCSDGRIPTILDGRMDISLASLGGASGLTCGQYEIAASRGQIAEDECVAIQSISESQCGCKVPEPNPTPAPTGFVCPICGKGMEVGFPEGEVILPNMQRMSCAGLQMRAESNIIQPTQCTQIQPFVREACACVEEVLPDPTFAPTHYECNICGEGREVTNPDGVVSIPSQPDRTCGDLMAAAEFGYITPNQCSLLNPFTQGPCNCISVDTTVPSDMPSMSPTAPTISPAPTSVMEREDCYASLTEIYEIEREVIDTSTQRTYVLCPGRTFHMGVWTEDGRRIKDGEPFIALRPNVVYQCGEDGSRNNNCILKGGDFGLASYYGVYGGIYESVENVEIRGLTFESQNLFSVLLKAAGDISFIGCAFKGNKNNVPVLVQWEGEGPDEAGAAQSSRVLRRLEEGSSLSNGLSHVVTFQDCVFRGNALSDNMSFPGIIENSFLSELVVTNCLFEDNRFGIKGNPAPVGYAIRSFGPTTIESSCFVNNVFNKYGPVILYGNQYSALNNYVEATQSDLTCEFAALFSSQDEMAEGANDNAPQCELSDALTCAFSQPPTMAPSVGTVLAEPATARPTSSAPESPPKKENPDGSSSSSSAAFSLKNEIRRRIFILSSLSLVLLPILSMC